MKLSIVIPVYRTEATLSRCIESIVSQSFRDYEVLLVDDGSPDNCPQLCDEWARRDTRISVIHQTNGGLSAARNAGIEKSQGDYITFIDSDDYIGTGTLEAVMTDIGDSDLLEYPIWVFYRSPQQKLLKMEDKTYATAEDYWLQQQVWQHTYACNKIFRRSLFSDVRFPVGRVFEDAFTLPQLLRKVRCVATTTRGCYYYCWNSKGITATADGHQLRMLLDAHLTAEMPMNDVYYMSLLNIQLDVCRLTNDEPRLPARRVSLIGGPKTKAKAILLNILGIKRLCSLNKTISSLRR